MCHERHDLVAEFFGNLWLRPSVRNESERRSIGQPGDFLAAVRIVLLFNTKRNLARITAGD